MESLALGLLLAAGTLHAQTSATSATDDLHCTKEISIYLDLSGTMTTQERGSRSNLNKIAETLHELLIRQDGFVLNRDRVNILLFGTEVRMIRSFEIEDGQDLETLAAFLTAIQNQNRDSWRPAVTSNNAIEMETISRTTDFGELFADIAGRVASGAERQIFVIASDLVHDTIGLAVTSDAHADERIKEFETAFDSFETDQRVVDAFGSSGGVRARMAVIAIETFGENQRVADSARKRIESLGGAKVLDRKGGAQPTADFLREYFAFPVTVAIDPEEYQRRTEPTTLGFIASNPNCGRVTIRQLVFSAGGETVVVTVDDGLIDATGQRSLDINVKDLEQLSGSEITVTPMIAERGKTEPTRFWFGDFIQFKTLSLEHFPRRFGVGRTLLVANVSLRLKSACVLTIRNLPNGEKKFKVDVPGNKNELVLAFDVAHGTADKDFPKTIVVESDGPMLMHARHPQGKRRLELNVDRRRTETAALRNQYATAGAVVLILIAFAAAMTRQRSMSHFVDWIDRAIFVKDLLIAYVPGVGYLVTRIASTFFEPWYLTVIGGRSFALAAIFCFAARQIAISWIWPWMEKSTLDPDDALTRRRWLTITIWGLTGAIFALSALDFYVVGIPQTARILEEIVQ